MGTYQLTWPKLLNSIHIEFNETQRHMLSLLKLLLTFLSASGGTWDGGMNVTQVAKFETHPEMIAWWKYVSSPVKFDEYIICSTNVLKQEPPMYLPAQKRLILMLTHPLINLWKYTEFNMAPLGPFENSFSPEGLWMAWLNDSAQALIAGNFEKMDLLSHVYVNLWFLLQEDHETFYVAFTLNQENKCYWPEL